MGQEIDIDDPVHGRIDVCEVELLVRHRAVQHLNRIQQLGGLAAVVPSARHTRFVHSLGCYHIASIRAAALVRSGMITPNEALALVSVALLHDAGHGPFSHLLEEATDNHDDRGLAIMQGELRPVLERMGLDMALITAIATRSHPLSGLIYDTPLGADKLDYLVRDPSHALGGTYNFRDMYRTHVGWNREIGIHLYSRGLADFMLLITTYWALYAKLYERISGRASQRYLQEVIRLGCQEIPELKARLVVGGEDEITGTIAQWSLAHEGHPCALRYQRLETRTHPRKAFIFSPRPDLIGTRPGEYHAALECDPELLSRSRKWTPENLSEIERRISESLGVETWETSLCPSPSERRWRVPDVTVMGFGGKLQPVSDLLPELHPTAAIYAGMGLSVVVCLTHTIRQRLAQDPGAQNVVREILSES